MSSIIVTGVNGFVGHHLAKELHQRGCTVIGVGREAYVAKNLENFLSDYITCDLIDEKAVDGLPLGESSALINLAGLANVGASFADPELYHKVNVGVLESVLNTVKNQRLKLRIIAVSTGAVYDSKSKPPFDEDSSLADLAKTSPYVASKLAMEDVAKRFSGVDADCIVVRPFNHLGPGQLSGFLLPDLANGIKNSIETGEPLMVGNLDTKRDYTDVRDVVKAYSDLATAKTLNHSVYNVASGRPISGTRILELIKNLLDDRVRTQVDKSKLRPDDPLVIYGDYGRLNSDTGWEPSISIEKTVQDFADWFKKQS